MSTFAGVSIAPSGSSRNMVPRRFPLANRTRLDGAHPGIDLVVARGRIC